MFSFINFNFSNLRYVRLTMEIIKSIERSIMKASIETIGLRNP